MPKAIGQRPDSLAKTQAWRGSRAGRHGQIFETVRPRNMDWTILRRAVHAGPARTAPWASGRPQRCRGPPATALAPPGRTSARALYVCQRPGTETGRPGLPMTGPRMRPFCRARSAEWPPSGSPRVCPMGSAATAARAHIPQSRSFMPGVTSRMNGPVHGTGSTV